MNENILFVDSLKFNSSTWLSPSNMSVSFPCFAIMLDAFQLAIAIRHISNPIYPSPLDTLSLGAH